MSDRDRAQLEALGAVPLTNDMTLIRVPKRHARRAELAVVLAELAEALGAALGEGEFVFWTHLSEHWEVETGQGEQWGLSSWQKSHRRFIVVPGIMETRDPLEAARLALAHVRGRG